MQLSQIFEMLTTGELAQVFVGGATQGEITEANYRTMGNHVMLGLTSLYKRFNLKQGRINLQLQEDQTTYPLHSRYAVQGKRSLEPVRWIQDTSDEVFMDDILKILSVTGDAGVEFPLNDYTDCYSVMTPTMETVRVPLDVVNYTTGTPEIWKTANLLITYQANHPAIVPPLGFFDPQLTVVELPQSHVQALLYYVASRVNNPIGMGQEFNAGNTWFVKYENECVRLGADGDQIDNTVWNDRARRNGWV